MPKTVRNAFDKALTYENLYKAHLKSRKGKGRRDNVIRFNLKQEEYISWLYEELKNMTYKHGGYRVFYVSEPKLRKIEASQYIDRIVHTWYVDSFLANNFMTQFIPTSYACIKDRGMHRAALDVQKAMKECKKKYGEYYILKMDIAKYFQNINPEILYKIINKKVKDEKILWLTRQIIYSKNDKGIPIGNYTSQIFANIYLNEVDQYIKRDLHIRYYFRYMDDSVILLKDKNELKLVLVKIQKYLLEKLGLELNKKTNIFKNKQGVNFCGYKINEYRLKIRDKAKKKLKKKVKTLKSKIKNKDITSVEAKKYLCGHMGYLKYANVYNLSRKIFRDSSDSSNFVNRGGNANNNGNNNPAGYRNNNSTSNTNYNIGFRVVL